MGVVGSQGFLSGPPVLPPHLAWLQMGCLPGFLELPLGEYHLGCLLRAFQLTLKGPVFDLRKWGDLGI